MSETSPPFLRASRRFAPAPDAPPRRQLGIAEGFVIYMADDFDAPLDDFAEYME